MRAARFALGAIGVAGVVWGGWLLRDDGFDRLRSTALWLAGAVVLHDAVLAPVVVLLGVAATSIVPSRHRTLAAVAFIVWGALTIAVANVLLDVGGKPGMDSLLNRPYVASWLVLSGVIAAGAIVLAMIRPGGARADDP